MMYQDLRQELKAYYWHKADTNAQAFFKSCTQVMDARAKENMSSYEMKAFQYETITELFEPVLFYHCPFYYETGTMAAHCDGARDFRGHHHAGGWTYLKTAGCFGSRMKRCGRPNAPRAELCFI